MIYAKHLFAPLWVSVLLLLGTWGLLEGWATDASNQVVLHWQTSSEVDLVGFFLYRGPSLDGPWTKLNETPLATQGDGLRGAVYSYTDRTAPCNTYYKIEEVLADGSRRSLPPVRVSGNCSYLSQHKVWFAALVGATGGLLVWLAQRLRSSRRRVLALSGDALHKGDV